MGTGLIEMTCAAMDPVCCPQKVIGMGTRDAAQKLLAHLDEMHVHHADELGWSLTFQDEGGTERHIGVDYGLGADTGSRT